MSRGNRVPGGMEPSHPGQHKEKGKTWPHGVHRLLEDTSDDEEMMRTKRKKHIRQFLTTYGSSSSEKEKAIRLITTGVWHGECMLYEASTGQVLDTYMMVSEMASSGNSWCRLFTRVWLDGKQEASLFRGRASRDIHQKFNIYSSTPADGVWQMTPISGKLIIVTAKVKCPSLNHMSVAVDQILSIYDDNTIIVTRQFAVGDKVTIEYSRMLRCGYHGRFYDSVEQAGALDLTQHKAVLDRVASKQLVEVSAQDFAQQKEWTLWFSEIAMKLEMERELERERREKEDETEDEIEKVANRKYHH